MNPLTLAVDVQGGDYGPTVVMQGLLEAVGRYDKPLAVYLCGNQDEIASAFEVLRHVPQKQNVRFAVEHCPQRISPRDVPARAWKTKAQSSIVRCVALQREGKADVSLSAGDTRFLMGASIFILGRMEGVARPALAAFLPTANQKPALLLDVGANLNCRAEQLAAFGRMGYAYAQANFGLEKPTVALLNIGMEPSKGPRNIREADRLLSQTLPGYIGFVEGGGVLSGSADVIVCDGFSGNIMLKLCESFYGLAMSLLKQKPELARHLKDSISILNPENYGAVPLLGIKGVVFKAHGSSTATVIANAFLTAVHTAERSVLNVRANYARKEP
jgi:glycerol-3-phosphate acyltransferase PlsX